MHKYHRLTRHLFELAYALEQHFAHVHDHLEPQTPNTGTGIATAATVAIGNNAVLASAKSFEKQLHLIQHIHRCAGRIITTNGVEQSGITFKLIQLQGVFALVDDGIQQVGDDLLGMQQAGTRVADKLRVAADVSDNEAGRLNVQAALSPVPVRRPAPRTSARSALPGPPGHGREFYR